MGSLTAADGQNRDVRFPPFELGHTAAARLMHTRKEPKSLHVCANLISFVIYPTTKLKTNSAHSTLSAEIMFTRKKHIVRMTRGGRNAS